MPNTLRLISLGARGVGKTVFLINSCANSLSNQKTQDSGYFFECDDPQSQEMVKKLMGYIQQQKAYPPATFKISNFNLSLKRSGVNKSQTVCRLQWSDIPGEWCSLDNSNFQSALLESHGCCLFIDADALLNQDSYRQVLEQNIKQIEAITGLIKQNNLVQYPIALICTKYDLIRSSKVGIIQLETKLKPLIEQIESSQGLAKRFYSGIPLLQETGRLQQVTNAENALLWMTTTLNSIHASAQPQNLGQMLASITQPGTPSTPSTSSPRIPKRAQKILTIVALVGGGLAAVGGLIFGVLPNRNNPALADNIRAFETILEDDPTNENAIAGLLKIYAEDPQQDDKSISLLESLHARSPEDLNILISLAQVYELQGDTGKQEETLNKILALDNINLTAIYSKVRLKIAAGQPNEAREIITQAQQNVTTPAFQEILKELSQEIPDT